MTPTLSPETVMALAILSAKQANEEVRIESVSSLFAKLRQARVDEVGRVAMRKLPHGLYSEDVEAFFGRLLAGGFAKARSPLVVNPDGIQLCQKLIEEESKAHPEALQKVALLLGFNLSAIKNPVLQQTPA